MANDTNSIINNEDYQVAMGVMHCGIAPALNLLGLPANILNMVVFYRQGLRDKMNLCLFSLAFVDFMYLLSVFILTLYCPAVLFMDRVSYQILEWNTMKYLLNFRYAFLYSSGMLTAIIATERCICVVWPLKSATIFKTKTIAWMIFAMIVVFNIL